MGDKQYFTAHKYVDTKPNTYCGSVASSSYKRSMFLEILLLISQCVKSTDDQHVADQVFSSRIDQQTLQGVSPPKHIMG